MTLAPAEPDPDANKVPVIYVAGAPFSGSTLLGLALGNSDGICDLGEVGFLERMWHDQRMCGCGTALGDCPFWAGIRTALDQADKPLLTLQTSQPAHPIDAKNTRFSLKLMRAMGLRDQTTLGRAALQDYATRNRHFFAAVREATGAVLLVDTTKTAARAIALARDPGIDLHILLLHRDPEAVFAAGLSRMRARNRVLAPLLPLLQMIKLRRQYRDAVKCAHLVGPDRLCTLHYEDLTRDPASAETRLSHWLGRPITFGLSKDRHIPRDRYHGFTGSRSINRDAGAKTVALRPADPPRPMGWGATALFRALRWTLPHPPTQP
ncbi:MAG: sulfotransferase [Rhodobacteraceae bacterium]|nr:sulfotransferase [Paracoccaceae bacterium]